MENKMFCFQCQETAAGKGCTMAGVCGKKQQVASMQDLLIYVTKGLCAITTAMRSQKLQVPNSVNHMILKNLFSTITNANFMFDDFILDIKQTLYTKQPLFIRLRAGARLPDAAYWNGTETMYADKAQKVGVLSTANDDIRSLREFITYGCKGMAAYMWHACVLDEESEELHAFLQKALAATLDDSLTFNDLFELLQETGKYGVLSMKLLNQANTEYYGDPYVHSVNLEVGHRPGILVSGHDLRDLEMLLEQTQNTGIDVYTHSEMLPAHYYPFFDKYKNLRGHYGNAWWKQKEEFASFNGPILMTTNCIIPPDSSYLWRMWTTGVAGYPGCKHIDEDEDGFKDFSLIINQAKNTLPPKNIENGKITGGFALNQLIASKDLLIRAIKEGKVKKIIVMAGCDGRAVSRSYYTEYAMSLPKETIILTAGCAKFRYNKLDLGTVAGIPRILDAGQCNDSYSLAMFALDLKETFGLKDVNKLPIVFNIAWYEQKAVIVLLSLLSLGFKNIHLGPTMPAFVSTNVARVLNSKFGLSGERLRSNIATDDRIAA